MSNTVYFSRVSKPSEFPRHEPYNLTFNTGAHIANLIDLKFQTSQCDRLLEVMQNLVGMRQDSRAIEMIVEHQLYLHDTKAEIYYEEFDEEVIDEPF